MILILPTLHDSTILATIHSLEYQKHMTSLHFDGSSQTNSQLDNYRRIGFFRKLKIKEAIWLFL